MRLSTKLSALTSAFVLCFFARSEAEPPTQKPLKDFSKLKDGDLVFIESSSPRAPAIKALTGFDMTHCGVVFNDGGKWRVYEGAGRSGSYLEIADWQDHESGAGATHDVYARKLRDREAKLTPHKLTSLRQKAKDLHDTKYDFGFAWTNRNRDDNTEYIYCSELIWKAFHEVVGVDLGAPHPLKDYYADKDKERRVREAFDHFLNSRESKKCRNGQDYDPNELAISPKEVFESSQLEAVTDETP
jgi:hypothetical protein